MDNTQDDISLEDVLGSGTRKPAKPTTQAEPIDPETCPFVIKANHLIREYGFTVSGKLPLAKMTDVDGWSSYNRLFNLKGNHSPVEFIRKNLKKRPRFADYEVVVFCECKARLIGHEEDGTEVRKMGLFVFDIDAKDVLEEVVAAIGPLPYGLTVQSRPKSAPWKQHRYFWHDGYSIEQFRLRGIESAKKAKDRRAREIRVEGQWDAKGSGAGGYVVSGDTPRENDEMYTYVDPEAPIPTVPHALVDWIIEKDRAQYASKHVEAKGTSMLTASIEECVRRCILSRAKTLANIGTRPGTIELCLKQQIEDFDPDNEPYDPGALLRDPKWIDRIHRYAYKNKKGNSDWFKSTGHRLTIGGVLVGSRVPVTSVTQDLPGALLAAIKEFPRDHSIPIAQVRERLESAMEEQGVEFNWRTRRNMINRARDAAGWASTKGRHAVWCASRSQVAMP